ncbi:hypothetical protein [Rhizobium leucaenae]|uniref:Lipoprotein n=1 Tax=Rhizobium leucaenae TaxID=29450 RepID=A0A7W7END6_9HYPH|nr:hypothetical protein [Rhizobium leucaenae]MBB4571484.1 hypothetical protein [Rhizobium leucaenae]
MTMKSMLVAAIVGFTGLILSSCVEEGPLYGTSGYNPGYYGGGAIFIGGGDHYRYRYRYDRNHYYRDRYRGHHDYRSGRLEYRGHRPEYQHGRPGGHHRIIPFDKNLSR